MSEEQTLDLAALKAAHHPAQDRIYETYSILYHGACAACGDPYPCRTVRLTDAYERQQADIEARRAENERLRAVIDAADAMRQTVDADDDRRYRLYDDVRAALQSREAE